MKIYDYKKTMPLYWCLVFCMSLFMTNSLSAQNQVSCHGHVNTSLGIDCELEIDTALFTKNPEIFQSVAFSYDPGTEYTSGTADIPCGTYDFTVTEVSGNQCWGTITIEDKLGPVFSDLMWCDTDADGTADTDMGNTMDDPCPVTCLYNFSAGLSSYLNQISNLPSSYVTDCETPLEVVSEGVGGILRRVDAPGEECDDASMVWFILAVADAKGNKGFDTLFFSVDPLDIDDLGEPGYFDGSCDSNIDPTTLPSLGGPGAPYTGGNTDNIPTSYEELDGTYTAAVCDLLIRYSDTEIPVCESPETCDQDYTSRKVLREWTIIDWCTNGQNQGDGGIETVTQILELKDDEAPTVDADDVTLSSDPWVCKVETYTFAYPEGDDNCTADTGLRYQLDGPEGVIIVGRNVANHIPVGEHTFSWTAMDCCGNVSEAEEFTVTVIDDIKPFAIAKEYTVASLIDENPRNDVGTDVIAKVYAASIDNNSWDACGPVELYVRREDGDARDCDEKDAPYATDGYSSLEAEFEIDPDPDGDGHTDWFGPYVKFCCEDLTGGTDFDGDGVSNEYRVELLVVDSGDPERNFSLTWGYVKVEDPNPPIIDAEDVTIFCHDEDEFTDERIIEIATAAVTYGDLCYEPVIEDGVIDGSLFDPVCKYGYFDVDFVITNPTKGLSETATVTVEVQYKDDFSCNDIADWGEPGSPYNDILDADCMENPVPDLTWDAGPCVLIGWSMDSDTFRIGSGRITGNECLKVINEWTVIDWCVYDHWRLNRDPDLLRYWKEHQEGDHDDSGTWIGGKEIHSFFNGGNGLGLGLDNGYNNCNRRLPVTSSEFNANHWRSGVYTWNQVIKVTEGNAPEIEEFENDEIVVYYTEGCGAGTDVTITAADNDDCPAEELIYELYVDGVSAGVKKSSTGSATFTIGSAEGAMLMYDVRAKVWDGCGNAAIYDFVVKLVDDKAPTPYCIDLSSALMQPNANGVSMVLLWAADFDNGATDNCPGTLYFTFDGVPFGGAGVDENGDAVAGAYDYIDEMHYYSADTDEDGTSDYLGAYNDPVDPQVAADFVDGTTEYNGARVYVWIPAGKGTSLLGSPAEKYTAGKAFTCDDYPIVEDLRVDVWDGKLNVDFCTVELRLEGANDCGGGATATVSGNISTEAGDDVSDVSVTLENLTNPEYKLTASTSNDGAYAFTNNPMYNSYDVSGTKGGAHDNGVSTLDLVKIQRHIIGIAPFTSPYKVIASDINNDGALKAVDLIILRKVILGLYDEFPSNTSWKLIDASQNLDTDNVLDDYSEIINIADLDANASNQDFVAVKIGDVDGDATFNSRGSRTTTRNNNTLAVSLVNKAVNAGDVVELNFSAADFNKVYGYQFTLELNGLEFQTVSAGSAAMTDDNVALLDANTLTVSYSDMNGLNATDDLFTISAIATKGGLVGDMVNISDSKIKNEAYAGNGLEVNTLELTLTGENVAGFNLGQNEPNPFNEVTVVGFSLPKAGKATITVYDVAGKVVTLRRGTYQQGLNQESFTRSELGTTGVLYYTLESGDFTATKKMIIIE